MKASISLTPAWSQASTICRACGAGQCERLFTQDVFACGRRRQGPLGMKVVGKRYVDGLDLGIIEQRLIRPVVLWVSPDSRATALARSSEREAMATTWLRAEPSIPGITFLTAISAQPRTPQRTGSMMVSAEEATQVSDRERDVAVQALEGGII